MDQDLEGRLESLCSCSCPDLRLPAIGQGKVPTLPPPPSKRPLVLLALPSRRAPPSPPAWDTGQRCCCRPGGPCFIWAALLWTDQKRAAFLSPQPPDSCPLGFVSSGFHSPNPAPCCGSRLDVLLLERQLPPHWNPRDSRPRHCRRLAGGSLLGLAAVARPAGVWLCLLVASRGGTGAGRGAACVWACTAGACQERCLAP